MTNVILQRWDYIAVSKDIFWSIIHEHDKKQNFIPISTYLKLLYINCEYDSVWRTISIIQGQRILWPLWGKETFFYKRYKKTNHS